MVIGQQMNERYKNFIYFLRSLYMDMCKHRDFFGHYRKYLGGCIVVQVTYSYDIMGILLFPSLLGVSSEYTPLFSHVFSLSAVDDFFMLSCLRAKVYHDRNLLPSGAKLCRGR